MAVYKKAYMPKYRKIAAERRKQIVDALKNECASCGFSRCKRALDFHHVNGAKEFDVSQALRNGFSIKRILAEIEKCVVLCKNCHQTRHCGCVEIQAL